MANRDAADLGSRGVGPVCESRRVAAWTRWTIVAVALGTACTSATPAPVD